MLTKNGKALLKITNSSSKDDMPTFKFYNGNINVPTWSPAYFYGNVEWGIDLGSGTTEPTVDDYTMEDIDTDLTLITSSNTKDATHPSWEQNYIASFSKTVKNNTENVITISEIGLYADSTNKILLAREVISPVTIAPQKTYTFSMTIG